MNGYLKKQLSYKYIRKLHVQYNKTFFFCNTDHGNSRYQLRTDNVCSKITVGNKM